MKISFTKMHGAGNDFMVLDDRALLFPLSDTAFIRKTAARCTGVGCDGVLLIQPSESADFRMRFINPDGGEVDMCGNGARCIARFAYDLGIVSAQMTIETGAGLVAAEVLGQTVRIQLTAPIGLRLDLPIEQEWPVDFVNTGVPHAVAWVDEVAEVNLPLAGRVLREHSLFAPEGTNANFAQIEADGSIRLRTYERGVEAETLACGTGAAAVAVLAHARGWASLPVTVHCAGGYDLVIDVVQQCILLEGGAERVFKGDIEYGNRI